jgi:hypothetical protein
MRDDIINESVTNKKFVHYFAEAGAGGMPPFSKKARKLCPFCSSGTESCR